VSFKDQTTSASQTVLTEVAEARAPSQGDENGCLVVIYGQEMGRRVRVTTEPLVIGRSPKCEIQVDQESVSRNHCRIRFEGGEFLVRDLGSTNGTYVNDDLVHDEGRLRHGDQLKVGRTILKFIVGDNVEVEYHEEIYRLMTTDGLTQLQERQRPVRSPGGRRDTAPARGCPIGQTSGQRCAGTHRRRGVRIDHA